jgi:hypothetical protein
MSQRLIEAFRRLRLNAYATYGLIESSADNFLHASKIPSPDEILSCQRTPRPAQNGDSITAAEGTPATTHD